MQRGPGRIVVVVGVLACLAASGCATKTQSDAASIAATPLHDLNLAQTEIPPLLQAARAAPYAAPAEQTCAALASQVGALDEILGPDLDAPANKDDASRVHALASDTATGAFRRTVEGVVPFRGWVRKLSGAERHDRDVQAAILAGSVRRGYLKGLMQAHACPPR